MFGRNKGLFLVVILTLVGLAFLVRPGLAEKPKSAKADAGPRAPIASNVPIVGRAVGFAETKPLRELAMFSEAVDLELKEKAEEINELNTVFERTPKPNAPVEKDGALQSSFGADGHFKINIPTPSLVFEGMGVNGSAPPDTTGAVGPNDYMQAVNGGGIRIWDKAGVPRGPAFKLSSLFAPLGPPASSSDSGDALVLYDRMANRWLITQFAFASQTAPPYHQPMAVSKTGDPTGAYWVYDFITPGSEFPDYGKIGAWPDGYYFTDRQFTAPGLTYNGFGVFAFDRAKMLVGDSTASYVYFNAGPTLSNASSGMIPSDFNGLTPPPAGAPNVFSVFTDNAFDTADALRLYNFCSGFPGSSCVGAPTFTERPESPLAVAAFDTRNPDTSSGSPSNRSDIEEPPPAAAADYLDSIGDRLMLRLQYINRSGTELLTTCHTVNGGVIPAAGLSPTVLEYRAATRHYVLQKTTPGGVYTVLDQATFAPITDTTERWMGSTALDNAGNLAVGYSTSSTTVFPSIAYAGRLATDPPNTLAQGEATMFAGVGNQTGTSNRWGDYSAMNLDPTDDATFWYTNEYYNPSGAFLWKTKIGAFKFVGTTAPPQGTLTGTITACDTGALLKDALVQVTGGPSTGFSSATMSNGVYSMQLSPGNYSATIVDPAHNCTAIGPFAVTITNGATTTLNQCLNGTATFLRQSSTVLATGGNGNSVIEPNECNNLNVTVLNNGCFLGSNITGVLSTTTPGVTITQPTSAYPNAAENATSVNSVPFQVSTSGGFACGTPINFTLTLTYAGGSNVFNFTLTTCIGVSTTISGSLDAGDTVQEGRMGRNAVGSICGTAKACPGIFGTGNRRYDVLTFPNGGGAACATITTTAPSGTTLPIIPVAYLNSYTPPGVGTGTNICLNYLGDPGGSPNTVNSFAVDVPANATLVVVVQEANAGQAAGSTYSVQVSGLVVNGVGPGSCVAAPNVKSRKVHGGAGPFDIPMPVTNAAASGVEDRTGNGGVAGVHTIVLSYTSDPTGATATVAVRNPVTGTGTVSGVSYSGNDMIVDLTGVSDKQVITLSTTGGTVTRELVPVGFLAGDTNSSRSVTASDVTQTKAAVSTGVLNGGNFRTDVNVTGTLTSSDIAIVKSFSGNALP